MAFSPNAATVYQDGPSTDPYEPSKPQIRALLTSYETVMDAFTTNAGLIFTSLAAMNAAAASYTEARSAWLFDGTNSGVYVLDPTTDTWTKVGRLPYAFVIGTDLGAGTADAIQITTDIPVSDGMIVAFELFESTSSSPVTVSINGGTALTLKTNRGNNASALTAGMDIWGRYRSSDNTLRLLNDQDVSALVAQAEAAAAAALAAANAGFVFDTESDFESANIPPVLQFVLTAGYYAPGDGGGHRKVKRTGPLAPKPWLKFVSDSWWEAEVSCLRHLGAKGDYDTDDTTAHSDWLQYISEVRAPQKPQAGNYRITQPWTYPESAVVHGAGKPQLMPFPLTIGDDKKFMRPGYKNLMPGTNFWYDGNAANNYTTQRGGIDAAFSTIAQYPHYAPCDLRDFQIIQDMDVYDAGGAFTTGATDNRSDVDAGFVYRSTLSHFERIGVFGYFPNNGVLLHRGYESADFSDPDYNQWIACDIASGTRVIGNDTAAGAAGGGCTGNRFIGCNIMGADHHTRADGLYTVPIVAVDGFITGSIGGFRGTTFEGCTIRGYANNAVTLDHCSDTKFIGCTFELSSLAGVTNADQDGVFTGTANTKALAVMGCNSTASLGLNALAAAITGPLYVVGGPEGGVDGIVWAMSGRAVRITDNGSRSKIQLTDDLTSTNTGVSIERNGSSMEFRVANTVALGINSSGQLSKATYQSGALTIAGGVVTAGDLNMYTVDTEAAAATDDLDTINGGVEGREVTIRPFSASRTVVIKNGTGNIRCGADITLDNAFDTVTLVYWGGFWLRKGSADNGA